ncbi:thiamine-phosphate kinase [Stieleria sp. TO1_6]|uniref:thiamine-phosphate kinase n=1 Tax=Stieleria tagensis TaxID=2956795 RepID=UPI00209B403B|nr:thiamine-phosphate kinase [Stieleria tagensis]MCO8124825.1 thiamine-phosphate kinase [Stieleria tagensis]
MEQSFLAYLRGRTRQLPQVAVGIGDDAAVIDPSGRSLIACTDQIIDGVDFKSADQDLVDIGYKAMAVNLSDIAAMGATADSALVTLALPKQDATKIAGEVYEGILQAAKQYDVAIAGGDISTYDGPLAISITLLGQVALGDPWLRSGALDGDVVLASGSFGGSIRGRHLRPTPRIALATAIRELATVHAAIDVSDGLSLDLDRMCASSGFGIELDVDAIPIHPDAIALAAKTGRKPFQHAWSDGEDFELLLAVSPDDAQRLLAADLPTPLTAIGTIVGRTGIWKKQEGKFQRLSPQGYEH